eukprot:5597831-Alexandrium_andersonii.AAC.1
MKLDIAVVDEVLEDGVRRWLLKCPAVVPEVVHEDVAEVEAVVATEVRDVVPRLPEGARQRLLGLSVREVDLVDLPQVHGHEGVEVDELLPHQ